MDEKSYSSITEALSLFKDLIKDVKNATKRIFIAKHLKRMANELSKVSSHFYAEEKKALESILNLHTSSSDAIDKADGIVRDIERVAKKLQEILGEVKDKGRLKVAIKVYQKESHSLLPSIEKVSNQLAHVAREADKVNVSVVYLVNFIKKSSEELEAKSSVTCAKTRGAAYGGAAGATVGVAVAVGIACAVIPVVGWIAGIVSITIGTTAAGAVSFGTAAGITEGLTIKQIQEQLQKGSEHLQNFQDRLEEMADHTIETTKRVEEKRKEILEIEAGLKTSNGSAKDALEEEEYFDVFIGHLKEELEQLLEICEDYFQE